MSTKETYSSSNRARTSSNEAQGDTLIDDTPQETSAEIYNEESRAGCVFAYASENKRDFPFEPQDVVYIDKPGNRAPVVGLRITRAHANKFYELEWVQDGTPYHELVEEKYLRRGDDAFAHPRR